MKWCDCLVEHSTWGIIVYDKSSGNIQYMNIYAKQTLEVEGNQHNVKDFITENKRPNVTCLDQNILLNEGYHHEICVKKPSGQLFYAELNVKKIPNEENAYALMFKDITYQLKLRREILTKQEEITRTYEELLQQNEELKALDKAKDKFIALTSHELRTPLSAMVATAEVLNENLVDTEEERQGFIYTIYEQGMYLLDIVNDILDFAKLQAGKADVYIEKQNTVPILNKILDQFDSMAKEKSVSLKIICEKEEIESYFDSTRLKQILSNVLSNAIKFTQENSEVTLSINEDETHVNISVIDQGDGIPAELQDKVFDEFVTLKNIHTHKKGTGLGMPISKKLVELMGGHIGIDDSYKDGAKFIIQIPKNKILNEELYRSKPDDEFDLLKIA